MTLGQEFTAFGHTILEDVDRLGEAQALIREINMGATAIGTGINAPPGYAEHVRAHLSRITGLVADHRARSRRSDGGHGRVRAAVGRAQALRGEALEDLQRPAPAQLRPARRASARSTCRRCSPGSSIMPGKVNPVIPEVVNQVCFDVIGGDVTVTMAAEAGQLQLNVFEPVIAYRLLRSIETLRNALHRAARALRRRHHGESGADAAVRRAVDRHRHRARSGDRLRDRRRAIAKEALESGRGVYELVLERGLLTREELDRAAQSGGDDRRNRSDRARLASARGARHAPASTQAARPGALSSSRSSRSRPASTRDAYFGASRRARCAASKANAARDAAGHGEARRVALAASTKRSRSSSSASTTGARSTVHALYEGDLVEAWDTVMTIEGDYAAFAHLETLVPRRARATARASAPTCATIVDAARPKPVLLLRRARRSLPHAAGRRLRGA